MLREAYLRLMAENAGPESGVWGMSQRGRDLLTRVRKAQHAVGNLPATNRNAKAVSCTEQEKNRTLKRSDDILAAASTAPSRALTLCPFCRCPVRCERLDAHLHRCPSKKKRMSSRSVCPQLKKPVVKTTLGHGMPSRTEVVKRGSKTKGKKTKLNWSPNARRKKEERKPLYRIESGPSVWTVGSGQTRKQ